MSDYIRGTIWADGQQLTPEALNAEFDRIAAVTNGGLELSNFAPGQVELPIVINAGDSRFQTGGLDRAQRVAGAIAEAVGTAGRKVVWIPRTMFGYIEDPGWNAGIFNTSVLLIAEGSTTLAHTPVAYGAKLDDAAVDDKGAFDQAVIGAAGAASGLNPGARELALTHPGDYQLSANVTIPTPTAIGYSRRAGCRITGAGVVAVADPVVDFLGSVTEEELATNVRSASSGVVAVPASGSQTLTIAAAATALNSGLPLQIWFTIAEDGGGASNPIQIANLLNATANFTVTFTGFEDTGGGFTATFLVTNNDGSNPHNVEIVASVRILRDTPVGT